ncbi:hypothetical protein [Caulobacter sp. LjRoot300]
MTLIRVSRQIDERDVAAVFQIRLLTKIEPVDQASAAARWPQRECRAV